MNTEILFFFFNLTSANPWLATTVKFFSERITYALPVLVVIYFYLFEEKSIKKIIYITSGTVGAYIFSDIILKHLFTIQRPFITLGFNPLVPETGFSFPSGHATMAGALFFAVLLSFPKRKYVTILVGILCVGIALSRVMLGVHYPIDIIAGWCVGMLSTYFLHKVFPYFQDLAKSTKNL